MTRGSEVRLCPAAIPFLPCPANLTTATATSATPQVKVQVHEKVRNHLSQSHEAPAPIARAHPQPKSELLIPKCRLFAITPILPIIYSSWSRSMTRGEWRERTHRLWQTQIRQIQNTPNTNTSEPRIASDPFFLLIPAAAAFCWRAVDKWKRKWKFHGDSSRLMVLLISTNLFDSHTMTYPFRGRKRQELDFVKRVKPIHTGKSSEMKRAVCPV